jgi:hypothetical protein
MPDTRPTWPDPSNGYGVGKADALLHNREAHQDQMREALELERLAKEAEGPKPGVIARIRGLFGRS